MGNAKQYLFARAYRLDIAPPKSQVALSYGNLDGGVSLRFSFTIESGAGIGKGKIDVYNLSQSSRGAVAVNSTVRVLAGYNGFCDCIFAGTVTKVVSKRAGPDIVTSIEALDGAIPLLSTLITKVWPKGTHLYAALEYVAQAMGVGTDIATTVKDANNVTLGAIVCIPDVQFSRPKSVSASAAKVLHELLGNYAVRSYIHNGKLNIVPKDRFNGLPAVVLSQTTGMINMPSKSKDDFVIESLINPLLVPGQLIEVVSQDTSVQGTYKINKLKIDGDTHDTKWQTTSTCVPMSATVNIATAKGLDFGAAVLPGQQ
jgi:hypothetical protein